MNRSDNIILSFGRIKNGLSVKSFTGREQPETGSGFDYTNNNYAKLKSVDISENEIFASGRLTLVWFDKPVVFFLI